MGKNQVTEDRRINAFSEKVDWNIRTTRTSNTYVLFNCGLPTMFTNLRQHKLCWLEHVLRMKWKNPQRYFVWKGSLLENAINNAMEMGASGTCKN